MTKTAIYVHAFLLTLGACSSLPTAGPTTSQVFEQATKQEKLPFSLIELSPTVLAAAANSPSEEWVASFRGKPPPRRVGVGDTVAVTIWQTGVLGVSSGTTGADSSMFNASNPINPGQITLPEQLISTDGGLTVPFAGRIRAAGRTTYQIQQAIEQGLAERLLEPKALVTVPRSPSDTATISGESFGGVRVPLSPGGDRLLDVIAAAGGPKAPLYETEIRLARGRVTGSILMDSVVLDPSENVQVWPGDSITLVHAPKTFSVFGATTNNNQLPFDAAQLSLAQAIARAGGLLDSRADPAGIFLFRFEPPIVAAALGAQTDLATASGVPTLYHLDLQKVGSYFLASRFAMKDNDIIYVANASSSDIQKFFTLIGAVTVPVLSGAILAK